MKNRGVFMLSKDGEEVKVGDVIRWCCFDFDDFNTWVLTGVYTEKGVIYLGGGADFGAAIGKIIPFDEVVANSLEHDEGDQGVDIVGTRSEVVGHIAKFPL
jgi:hypothetical protein